MQRLYLLQQTMHHKGTDPVLRPSQNSKIFISTQTHTTKYYPENKRRDKIITLQKAEAKLTDLPVSLEIGKHVDRLMATYTAHN